MWISAAGGKDWYVETPIAWEIGCLGSGRYIEIPKGFRTDFASIPWFARWFVTPLEQPQYRAAALHDVLYRAPKLRAEHYGMSRKECDEIFLDAMLADGTPRFKAAMMWFAVRIGGAFAYRTDVTV